MSGAARVRIVPGRMLATVELDDQAMLDAAEVSDARNDGMLAPELGRDEPPITQA